MTHRRPSAGPLAVALVCASCLDTSVDFQCRTADQCLGPDGTKGTCEPGGFCAFPDLRCPSGRRYGLLAVGPRAGECVACGNGQRDPGEQCDDGNTSNNDGCLTSCLFAACGDGVVRVGVEECDDGNAASGDGCNAACMRCASGVTWEGNRHCYIRNENYFQWEEAEKVCARGGGHLVAYTSDSEVRAVGQALLGGGVNGWIGLRDRDGRNVFSWVTGEPVNTYLSSWNRARDKRAGTCVTQTGNDPWVTSSCDRYHRSVCEHAPWAIRPLDNHAYRMFYQKLTFAQARELCMTYGAHLVTMTDADEHGFISAQFYGTYWTGGFRDDPAQPFQWTTGERLTYTDFLPGDPNLREASCLVVSDDRKWRDRLCAELLPFVCEKD